MQNKMELLEPMVFSLITITLMVYHSVQHLKFEVDVVIPTNYVTWSIYVSDQVIVNF